MQRREWDSHAKAKIVLQGQQGKPVVERGAVGIVRQRSFQVTKREGSLLSLVQAFKVEHPSVRDPLTEGEPYIPRFFHIPTSAEYV